MLVKTLLALTVASIGIFIAAGDGAAGLGIGMFLLLNAFLVLGSLVWA